MENQSTPIPTTQAALPTGLEHLQLPSQRWRWLWRLLKRHPKTAIGVYLGVTLGVFGLTELVAPRWVLHFTLANLIGISASVITVLIRDGLSDTIKNRDQLQKTLPLILLGVAPITRSRSRLPYALYSSQMPDSPVAHAFRALHQNLLSVTQQQPLTALNITSTDASEGKSSTTINLATVFAQSGKKVLLVDADLRRPTLHQHLNLDNTKGLGHFLAELSPLESVIQSTAIDNLFLIPAGAITPHPVELLSTEHLPELVEYVQRPDNDFDLLIIDSPPVMGLADALLISNRIQSTIMVVAAYQTKRAYLESCVERLQQQGNANLIGMVLTKYE